MGDEELGYPRERGAPGSPSVSSEIAHFNRLHDEKLIRLPGVRQTRTFFVMKEVVDNAPLVI
jgi:hypothetical protein